MEVSVTGISQPPALERRGQRIMDGSARGVPSVDRRQHRKSQIEGGPTLANLVEWSLVFLRLLSVSLCACLELASAFFGSHFLYTLVPLADYYSCGPLFFLTTPGLSVALDTDWKWG